MEEQNQNLFEKWLDNFFNFFNQHRFDRRKVIVAFSTALVLVVALVLFVPPSDFPVGSVVEISSGQSLQAITINLHSKHIIGSELIFRSLVILFGGEKKVIAGDYLLGKSQGAFALARRLVNGQFDIGTKKITIPEGWNVFQIADYLGSNILQFDRKQFLQIAKSKEGYLFPDTYFVSGSVDPPELVKMMQGNFLKKIAPVQEQISDSGHSERDIVIMASILEEEAMPKDRNVVAGILWKRLQMGMPLQVDSTFSYINGKNTYELTLDDLKINSPYNTYLNKGLPPGPISNPGVDSIMSAINPIKTKYLYFLTEKDGTIHYAKTFQEHIENKELYLK